MRISASGVVTRGGTAMARTFTGNPNNAVSVAETTALPSCTLGFLVNATSTGVISLASVSAAGAAGTAYGANLTLPAAGTFVTWPGLTPNGLFCTVVSGSCDLTFFVIE